MKTADITDGTAYTYMLGEKNVWADHYFDGIDDGDNNYLYMGYDKDLIRWGNINILPYQDTPGAEFPISFGTALMPPAFTWLFATLRSSPSATRSTEKPIAGLPIARTAFRSRRMAIQELFQTAAANSFPRRKEALAVGHSERSDESPHFPRSFASLRMTICISAAEIAHCAAMQ